MKASETVIITAFIFSSTVLRFIVWSCVIYIKREPVPISTCLIWWVCQCFSLLFGVWASPGTTTLVWSLPVESRKDVFHDFFVFFYHNDWPCLIMASPIQLLGRKWQHLWTPCVFVTFKHQSLTKRDGKWSWKLLGLLKFFLHSCG